MLFPTGWNGNQVLGGLLLHSTRRPNQHACNQRFDKFTTLCTEQQVVYDEDSGKALAVNAPTGGVLSYGVDPVFLSGSTIYDSSLNIRELPQFLTCTLVLQCSTQPLPSMRPLIWWRQPNIQRQTTRLPAINIHPAQAKALPLKRHSS